MNFSKIDTMTETYDTVIDSLARDRESHFITEENFYILHWLYRIRKAGLAKGIRIRFIQPDFLWVIYTPMMRIKKLWRTDDDIHEAADLWCTHRAEAEEKYGHISDWDVSSVTDMSNLFSSKTMEENMQVHQILIFRGRDSFNEDLSQWDVSKVTNMQGMFKCAFSFNKPIGDWDVSNVTNMSYMFAGAFAFNQAIGEWDVSKVTDMSVMFASAYAFNKPINNWDMSNVTDMNRMFLGARAFNKAV